MDKRRIWWAVLLWPLCWPTAGRTVEPVEPIEPVELLQAPLRPTRLAELAHETRPVIAATDALQIAAHRWSVPEVQVPREATLLAGFGLPPSEGSWLLEVSLLDSAGRPLQVDSRTVSRAGWENFALPVAPLAGQVVTLQLLARPLDAGDQGDQGDLGDQRDQGDQGDHGDPVDPGEVLLAAPRFLQKAAPRARFKNVLLVSLDTLRSDRMSAYGAALPTTPRMAALADTGVRFNTARAPASSTPPSHMTMLTGASPCTHGVWGVHVEDQPPVDLESLAQILSREGYSTRAVTENAFVGAPWGFARGFDSFLEFKGTPRADGRIAAPTGLGPRTFAAARQALRDLAERRFFLFVHTYQVHAPRRPEEPYASLFPEASASEAAGTRPATGHNPADHDIRRYDQLVRQLDDLVAGLLDELEALGLTDETLIVLTSDHGEAFFEHDAAGHGFWVWDEVLRIPLILAGPGIPSGAQSGAVVGLQDIVPTVLDLLGQPVPAGVDGRTLQPLWGPDPAPESIHYAETAPGGVRALSSRRYRIHREGSRESDIAFDLSLDPEEKAPIPVRDWSELPAKQAAELGRLRGLLDDWAAKCRLQRESADRIRIKQVEVDPLRREKLRALGYVD